MQSIGVMAVILVILFCIWTVKSKIKEHFTSYSGMPMPPLIMTDTIAIVP
jgi:hypothetical protein